MHFIKAVFVLHVFILVKMQISALPQFNICCASGNKTCTNQLITQLEAYTNLTKYYSFSATKLPSCLDADALLIPVEDLYAFSSMEDFEDDLTVVTANGYFRHNRVYFSSQDYCVNNVNQETLRFSICKSKLVLPKCCPPGELIDMTRTLKDGQTCVRDDQSPNWAPVFYKDRNTKSNQNALRAQFKLERNWDWDDHPECNQTVMFTHQGRFAARFRILSTGEITVQRDRFTWTQNVKENYCIDGAINFGDTVNQSLSDEQSTILIHCIPASGIAKPPNYTISGIYYIAMLVASFFLVLTIIVYLLLWQKHTLHGWTLLSYFVALLLMNVSLVAVFISSERAVISGRNSVISRGCQFIAMWAHFCILSAFAWMTIINFDLWSKFRNLKSTISPSKGVKRYLCHFGFATLVPAIIVAVGILLDLTYGDDLSVELTIPDYGKKRCYLDSRALLPYIFGPTGLLLTINLILFTITMISIQRLRESTKVATTNSSTQRHSPYLIGKLCLAMGIPWTVQVFLWLFEPNLGQDGETASNEVPWYLMLPDLVNILLAVAIFVIFVCKRDIVAALRQNYSTIDFCCHSLRNVNPFGSRRNPENNGSNLPSQLSTTRTSKLSNTDLQMIDVAN